MSRHSENWLEHALRRSGWQPQRQVVALATLGFIIALVLGVLFLSQVASDAATRNRLTEFRDERDELERVNEQLRVQIAALKNVPHLYSRAEELGFSIVEGTQMEYLVVLGYVPEQVDTVAPISADETSSHSVVYDETFTEWLGRQWSALLDLVGG